LRDLLKGEKNKMADDYEEKINDDLQDLYRMRFGSSGKQKKQINLDIEKLIKKLEKL